MLAALRGGKEKYALLLENPDKQFLPKQVVPFIRNYIEEHDTLMTLHLYPRWTRTIECALQEGKLNELYQCYTTSSSEQQAEQPKTEISKESTQEGNRPCTLM